MAILDNLLKAYIVTGKYRYSRVVSKIRTSRGTIFSGDMDNPLLYLVFDGAFWYLVFEDNFNGTDSRIVQVIKDGVRRMISDHRHPILHVETFLDQTIVNHFDFMPRVEWLNVLFRLSPDKKVFSFQSEDGIYPSYDDNEHRIETLGPWMDWDKKNHDISEKVGI